MKNFYFMSALFLMLIFCNNIYSNNIEIGAVYEAVIKELIRTDKEIITLSEDAAKPYYQHEKFTASVLRRYIPGIPGDLSDNFIVSVNKAFSLKEYIKDTNRVTWITDEYFDKFMSGKAGAMYEYFLYSRGVYKFSNIGFNNDNSKAILFVEFYCGVLCGTGIFYILEKENEVWRVVYKATKHVS